jgi:hypothetical protein
MKPEDCKIGTPIYINDNPRDPFNIGIITVMPYLYKDKYMKCPIWVVGINWGDGDISKNISISRLTVYKGRNLR